MSKIKRGIRAMLKVLRQPSLLNLVLDRDEEWQKYILENFPSFKDGLPVVSADVLFGDFDVEVEPFAYLEGGSLPTDIGLLRKFASQIKNCLYFEIGTWRGESVANVAAENSVCYTLNLPAATLVEQGYPEKYATEHYFFSKDIETITHLEGDSRIFDFEKLDKKFDLIFIDGDHHYQMVRNDTMKVLNHLVHDETIIVWHDYARNPEKVRFEVLAGILDSVPADNHKNLYHFANSLSAFYTRKKLTGESMIPPVSPKGYFKIDLTYYH